MNQPDWKSIAIVLSKIAVILSTLVALIQSVQNSNRIDQHQEWLTDTNTALHQTAAQSTHTAATTQAIARDLGVNP